MNISLLKMLEREDLLRIKVESKQDIINCYNKASEKIDKNDTYKKEACDNLNKQHNEDLKQLKKELRQLHKDIIKTFLKMIVL